jgi:hypothetical protein
MKIAIVSQEEIDDLNSKVDRLLELVEGMEKPVLTGVFSEEKFAETLGISRKTAFNFRNQGAIAYSKCGRRILYTAKDISEFLERNRRYAFKYERMNR